jgi:uncharacterized protein (TIGR03118 family)
MPPMNSNPVNRAARSRVPPERNSALIAVDWGIIVNRYLRIGAASAATALLALFSAAPAAANPAPPRFTQVNQVADQASAHPAVLDPALVNPWGLALSPTGPLWVANNHTNTATIYPGGVNGAPVTKAGLTVTIPGGAPTGQVFNGGTDFVVTGTNGAGPARFIFVSEDGDVTGWSPAATPTAAILAAHVDGANYKGAALAQTAFGPFLLAADFAHGRIDVFDRSFHRLSLPAPFFRDPRLPKGYAPFNIMVSGDTAYVAYAVVDPATGDEVAGAGLGIVDAYTDLGLTVRRVASHGVLNAPWGLAIAPASFGSFAGALLVGNFGDGRISAYRDGHLLGQLRDAAGRRIAIDGLWALLPGTAASGGVNTLWFSAGPDDETHGLVGQLIPAS